jgi:hypothetical protein
MGNPYLIAGNAILGLTAGYFMSKGWETILSALLAFVIQAAWIWVSDVAFMGMPQVLVAKIMLALLVSNLIWATAAKFVGNRIARLFK